MFVPSVNSVPKVLLLPLLNSPVFSTVWPNCSVSWDFEIHAAVFPSLWEVP